MVSVGLQGSYAHKLDSKGRMVLPARFREEMGSLVVATIGIERCVAVYPKEQWNSLLGRLGETSSGNGRARDLRRIILASAHELEIDGTGRILVPQQLRSYANIASEVSVNGNGDKLEIWDLTAWNDYREALWREVRDIAEGVPGI